MARTSKYSNAPAGQRFGLWTVQGYSHGEYRGYHDGTQHYWLVKCDCGTERPMVARTLARGQSTSCGCTHSDIYAAAGTKHGYLKGTCVKQDKVKRISEYTIWSHIKDRCTNPKNNYWHRYGGRGIRRCQTFTQFETFIELMGFRSSTIHSIDRIDNDGHYSCGKCEECQVEGWPMNCRWATPKEQTNNRSCSKAA